jgi:hypothetical protein
VSLAQNPAQRDAAVSQRLYLATSLIRQEAEYGWLDKLLGVGMHIPVSIVSEEYYLL